MPRQLFYSKNALNLSILEMFLTVFSTYFHTENTVRNIAKIDQIKKFGFSIKAAVVSNFCLIGKIHHNFLVPRMIELACKTFMPIQTLVLHRVKVIVLLYYVHLLMPGKLHVRPFKFLLLNPIK